MSTAKSARWALALLYVLSLSTGSALAANSSFPVQDGVNRAPGVVLHCALASGVAVPCGIAAQPIIVSPIGGATAANQNSEISNQQAMEQGIGQPGDAQFTVGGGSIIALLKGIFSELGTMATGSGGIPISRTQSVVAQQSIQLFAANANRHYMAFQVPPGSYLWVNLVGGIAAPNGADCAYFGGGTFYESGSFVNRSAVTIYSPTPATISAWEE